MSWISSLVGRQVKNELNSATRKNTKPAVTKGLNATDVKVQPKMVEVEYYESEVDVAEYDPQSGFNPQVAAQGGKLITTSKFFVTKNSKKVNIVAVIGGAGYGKTEILKQIANDALDKKLPELEGVKVVYFIYFRDIPFNGKVTAGNLLFGKKNYTSKRITRFVKWIQKKSEKILLVLDGADQYQQMNELGKYSSLENPEIEASPVEIINAILSGKLFPGIHILFSAREHAIRHFETEIRPDRTVALIGFSLPDIEKLVVGFGGEHGHEIWTHLNNKSQCLLSVCSIPMFLNFTVLAFLKGKKAPEYLTEVLMEVLYNMVTSAHMRSKESIHKVIQKLRKMAFDGTREGRVTFKNEDLPSGLNMEEVQDLLIPYPGNSGLNQKLVDGLFQFVFSHQSLQEALSSLYINQMNVSELKQFLEKLHQPQWAIVRRFTYGIAINKKVQSIVKHIELPHNTKNEGNQEIIPKSRFVNIGPITAHQVLQPGAISQNTYTDSILAVAATNANENNLQSKTFPSKKSSSNKTLVTHAEEKSRLLRESLTKELERAVGHLDLLELLHSLHECGESIESILPPSMNGIIFGDIIPSLADAYVIGAIAKKCNQIRHVFLNTINAAQLSRLANVVKEQKLKVKFRDTTIPQQGKELVNLLQVFLECGDDIHDFLPSSLTKIALGDFVPSQSEFSVIAEIARKCDQIRHVALNTINAAQLSGLAKVIKERLVEVTLLHEKIEMKNRDLLQLFRAFTECGDSIARVIKSSVKIVHLNNVKLDESNVDDLMFVLKLCNDLEYLGIRCFDAALFQTVAQRIITANLQIRKFKINFTNSASCEHMGSTEMNASEVKTSYVTQLPLSKFVPTICNLIPHVTDRLKLIVSKYDDKYKNSLPQIQEKLDSLPETELEIDIGIHWKGQERGCKPLRRLR